MGLLGVLSSKVSITLRLRCSFFRLPEKSHFFSSSVFIFNSFLTYFPTHILPSLLFTVPNLYFILIICAPFSPSLTLSLSRRQMTFLFLVWFYSDTTYGVPLPYSLAPLYFCSVLFKLSPFLLEVMF